MHYSNQKYDTILCPDLIPTLPLFDFESAFPSVIHEWIFLVLEHRGLPQHFLRLFRAIYINARAVRIHEGRIITLILFLSGVLQGCPGSAFLFNNSLDPFLFLIDKFLKNKKAGIVRACADRRAKRSLERRFYAFTAKGLHSAGLDRERPPPEGSS